MEQKTEASQAVDLPVLPHLPRAVGYRHTMDNTEGIKGNKPQIYFSSTKPAPFGIPGLDYSASFPVTTEALFTADQMKEYARAALKAQPAPTEAAQGPIHTINGTFDSPLAYIDYLHNELANLAAQGEDSARLDWLIENVSSGSIGFINGDFIGSQDFDELKVYIDRARASAETGGVKP